MDSKKMIKAISKSTKNPFTPVVKFYSKKVAGKVKKVLKKDGKGKLAISKAVKNISFSLSIYSKLPSVAKARKADSKLSYSLALNLLVATVPMFGARAVITSALKQHDDGKIKLKKDEIKLLKLLLKVLSMLFIPHRVYYGLKNVKKASDFINGSAKKQDKKDKEQVKKAGKIIKKLSKGKGDKKDKKDKKKKKKSKKNDIFGTSDSSSDSSSGSGSDSDSESGSGSGSDSDSGSGSGSGSDSGSGSGSGSDSD